MVDDHQGHSSSGKEEAPLAKRSLRAVAVEAGLQSCGSMSGGCSGQDHLGGLVDGGLAHPKHPTSFGQLN